MAQDGYRQHISGQFNAELDAAKSHMLEMGGLVQRQILAAVGALIEADSGEAEAVVEGDAEINAMEVTIDDECFRILARRQPAASDLRLVLTISKVVTDLERIGDEAAKVARQAILQSEQGEPRGAYVELRQLADFVVNMLHNALDAFARLDVEQALAVAQGDREADQEYAAALSGLVDHMMQTPAVIPSAIHEMWALRSLERVGDHARNIAEYVIYLVKGIDVRHVDLDTVSARLER